MGKQYTYLRLSKLEGRDLRNPYSVPGFNLCAGRISFSRIAPKLLNSFLKCFFKLNFKFNNYFNNSDNHI